MPWSAEHLADDAWRITCPTREDVDYLSDLAERAGVQLGTSRTEDGGRTTFRVDAVVLRRLQDREIDETLRAVRGRPAEGEPEPEAPIGATTEATCEGRHGGAP